MTAVLANDEFEALEEVAGVMVATLFTLEAQIGECQTSMIVRDAALTLMAALDALAAMHRPNLEQAEISTALH